MSWLTSILGMDAQHNAGKLGDQAAKQEQEALAYRKQAAGGYQNVQQQGTDAASLGLNLVQNGQQDRNTFENALPGLIQSFGATAGLNNPTTYSNGATTYDPYALTPAEQTQLNGHVDQITSGLNAALAHYKADMARRGITNPADTATGEALIRQTFGAQAEQHKANFAEQARTNRQQGLTTLMQYLQGLGNSGNSQIAEGANQVNAGNRTYESGVSGIAGLGGAAQNGSAQSQSESVQQQQMANNQFGSLLNLGTFAATGGFSVPKSPSPVINNAGNAPTVNAPSVGNSKYGI